MEKRIPILITADSVCDLPQELIKQYHIAINPYIVETEEGQFVDGQEIETDDLMLYMSGEKRRAKSEPPQTEDYVRFFKEQLLLADHLIHITMGRNASEGFARAFEASKQFNNVTVVDSGQLSSGMGLLVLRAAKLAEEGCQQAQLLSELERAKKAVSTSFVVQDTEFLHRSGRLPDYAKNLCDRLLLHPVLCMKDSTIRVKSVLVGQWKNVMQKYVRMMLKNPWNIDGKVLFITHVNLDEESKALILEEVHKICSFKEVYFQKASPAIACNCGPGSFGLLFMRKIKEPRQEQIGKYIPFMERMRRLASGFNRALLKDEYSIQQKMLNLTLSTALIGGIGSLIVMISIQTWKSALLSVVMFIVVGITLYISTVKNNLKLAGLLICFFANMIFFPLMFFTSGGIDSGMPIWFVLGLVFDFLILKGWTSIVMFAANLIVMIGCILAADRNPDLLIAMPPNYQMSDVVQNIVFISAVFGVIIKYQTYVYEKQRQQLLEHEQELLAANSAKSSFLANMSHEIRTPINGIIGMNTMMLRECGDNETLMEYGLNIQSASRSLLAIVNDILDISKIESGKLEIIPVEYELFSVVSDCYNMTASRAANKGLEFMVHMNPSLPSGLLGDEIRIRQIINNFLSNAVKYTEEGTVELNLDYERKSDAAIVLVISVRDTGIGIRGEDMDKLFENFMRLDEKRNSSIEGTGLGLNLTKKLVDLMHGEITVNSVYNQGSVFTAKIPQMIRKWEPVGDFAERYQELLNQKDTLSEVVYAPKARVLVVDDVPMNLLVAKGLLKYTGIRVDTASGGQEALDMICKISYDLIFLDHLMPGMDGVECFHHIREMQEHPNITTPIIVLTANAVIGAREEYLQIGFTDYLPKPIQERELQSMLMKYLKPELVGLRRMEDLVHGAVQKNKEQEEELKEQIEEKPKDDPVTADEAKRTAEPMMTEHSEKSTAATVLMEDSGKNTAVTVPASAVELSDLPVMERLKTIRELDTAVGMGYCMDSEDFYVEMLREYLNSGKQEAMNRYFAAQDWENYRITVHTLKSTSMTIGAVALSGQAKALEKACKEHNISYVQENHAPVLECYEQFFDALKKVLDA